jgi:hypothetical protein
MEASIRVFRRCQGLLGDVQGVLLCQKRLRLSCEVDECKPLLMGIPAGLLGAVPTFVLFVNVYPLGGE